MLVSLQLKSCTLKKVTNSKGYVTVNLWEHKANYS